MLESRPKLRSGLRLAGFLAALAFADLFATTVGAILPVRHYLTAALLLGACAFVLARRRAPREALALAATIVAFTAALAWWPWNGRKEFFRDVDAIGLGAARTSVRERMAEWTQGWIYGDEHFTNPYANHARVDQWHHNGSTRYDSFDHAVVRYDAADRVIEVERIVD